MAELEAGRDLDARIARELMGWTYLEERAWQQRILTAPDGTPAYSTRGSDWAPTLPAFSTDIAAAWQVVEHLRGLGWYLGLEVDQHVWYAHFNRTDGTTRHGVGVTAPLAICRAALAAVAPQS